MTPAGHNSEREAFVEQTFHNTLRNLRDHKSEIAGEMAEMKDLYSRAKELGIPKSVFKWAMELEDKDVGEVIRDLEWKIKAARWLGHPLGRQLDLLDVDRADAEERAYAEGLAAGKQRAANDNPYGADSPMGQSWQKGFNEGTSFINKELAQVIDDPDFAAAAE